MQTMGRIVKKNSEEDDETNVIEISSGSRQYNNPTDLDLLNKWQVNKKPLDYLFLKNSARRYGRHRRQPPPPPPSSSSQLDANNDENMRMAFNNNEFLRLQNKFKYRSTGRIQAIANYGGSILNNQFSRTDNNNSMDKNNDLNKEIMQRQMIGHCKPGQCGPEAACLDFHNNTYVCLCPHDSSPPTSDLKCPNRLTVPLTPRPIHNIIPPGGSNNSSTTTHNNSSNTVIDTEYQVHSESSSINLNTSTKWPINGVDNLTISLYGVGILLVLLITITVCWWKRSWFGNDLKARCSTTSPMNLKKSLLVAERYTLNPQYSACTSPCVPLLTRDSLKFHQEIGEGCFGKVYKGELNRDMNDSENGNTSNNEMEIVAIKVLKDTASMEAEDDFMREVDIMSTFRHRNILTLIGVVLREANLSPWMVFEYMPHGDLAEVLRSNSKSPLWQPQPHAGLPTELTCEHLLSAAQQIASGMKYLAAQRFVHRDLACRNCLVGRNFIVKIADFGMSRDVYTCDYYKIGGSRLLPVRWMSPESVTYGRFTLESDIWSYGVVLWEIFSYGKQPYFGHNNEEVVKLILQGIMLIPPQGCPAEVCDIMRCCWKTEPRDRIKFTDILERLEKLTQTNQINTNTLRSNTLRKKSVTTTTLPRPPPVPVTPNFDLLDREGYLIPQPHNTANTEYIQTLPD